MSEKRRGGGIVRTVGTFALGATAGSLVALLFAPTSGRVTRRRIGMQIRTLQRAAGRQFGEVQRVLARKAQTIRQAATQQLGHAREWVTERVTNGRAKRLPRRRALHHA